MKILLSYLIAFSATVYCIWLLMPLAKKIGLLDNPNERKHHQGSVPLVGGIAIFFGFGIAAATLPISLSMFRGLFAACALLVLMGVVDDFHQLSAKLRMLGQVLAALMMTAWGGLVLHNLGNLFFLGDVHLYAWGLPITVFAVVSYINAMNMMDGQDGLAGGIAFVQFALLAFIAWHESALLDMHLLLVLLAALFAFLLFNWRIPGRSQAWVFLGDAGSTFLGFAATWFAVHLSQRAHAVAPPITFVWILALPMLDIMASVVRRVLKRRSPLAPDRGHFHHVIHQAGIDVSLSTPLLCLFAFLCGLVGVIGAIKHVQAGYLFLAFIALFVVFTIFVSFGSRLFSPILNQEQTFSLEED